MFIKLTAVNLFLLFLGTEPAYNSVRYLLGMMYKRTIQTINFVQLIEK